MTIRRVKRTLADSIKKLAAEKQKFSRNPGKDNTRNRKLPFEKVVAAILSFQGGTLNRELMDFFDLNSASPTTSAFVQQRAKILPAAFESLFHHFTDRICEQKTYNGYRLFAVDGSDLQIAANPQDADSFYPGANGQKSYNLLHINAMYDLLQHIYVDAIIQKSRKTDESAALRLPLIITPKPSTSSPPTQSFEKKRNSSALFAREINLVTQPSFDCEQGINSQVQTACSNADAVFPVLGIVFCKNERFSLSRKTHVPLWNESRISHVRLL